MPEDALDKTTLFRRDAAETATATASAAIVTIFDGDAVPRKIDLHTFGKDTITFGRDAANDIALTSKYVSRRHGHFRLAGNRCHIENNPASTNGLIFAGRATQGRTLEDGDSVRIDDGVETTVGGVLIVFSSGGVVEWKTFPVGDKGEISIGRGEGCEIRLDHVSVSRLHARIERRDGAFYLTDNNSTNGVMVNGKKAEGRVLLHEKDLIIITNSKIIFSSGQISYHCFKKGVGVEGLGIVKKVGGGRVICSGVDITVDPCEMVTIVGGSGAGKSTIMNCLSGYSQPTEGSVAVNGVDLYEHFDALKNIIGYVPQSDIVYDNLTVYDMLKYAARLRLPDDTSEGEMLGRIDEVIGMVGLAGRKDTLIRNLSGGQRKRASIAVELLSDPNLLFLDEPASGLDPGTEKNLMKTLRAMSDGGKTVVFVTHSTLNLRLCDRIAFMGVGGHLCFYGTLDEALAFFGVDDVVDVYDLISDEPERWRDLYAAHRKAKASAAATAGGFRKHATRGWARQVAVLCKRNLHMTINDRTRSLLLLLQAPLLGFLISIVANGEQFAYPGYGITKGLLFALSCSAFWVGILNSIQEVCKERVILKREYMTGLRLETYIISKVLVMALVCAVQSLLLVSAFAIAVGLPEGGVVLPPFVEMLATTFLTAMAASAMGIFVSSLFTNADRAMTIAPVILIPQILFSGIIFLLDGWSKVISYMTVCRWSMEAYGTTADMNSLDTRVVLMGADIDKAFEFTASHLTTNWIVLGAFVVVFSIMAWFVLKGIDKERK
jgi:ABC-type multidrug transport system ATPase subunit/pSer/pThr/pTyr-binding forkhead associated (FHA) protein